MRSLLGLLEQCEELPEKNFISSELFFNDSEAVKGFNTSNDFQTVDFDPEELESGE